jgi:hypothetical protein
MKTIYSKRPTVNPDTIILTTFSLNSVVIQSPFLFPLQQDPESWPLAKSLKVRHKSRRTSSRPSQSVRPSKGATMEMKTHNKTLGADIPH